MIEVRSQKSEVRERTKPIVILGKHREHCHLCASTTKWHKGKCRHCETRNPHMSGNVKNWIPAQKAAWMTILLMFIVFTSVFAALSKEDAETFKKANENYRKSKYSEAAELYNSLSVKYPDQAVFLYNLANALHRQNQLGAAIVAYEQALSLDPRNADIRANLNFVRGLVQYRVDDKRSWYLKAGQEVLDYFTEKEIISAVLFTYLILAFGWAFALFLKPGSAWGWKRRTLLIISAFLFLIGLAKNVEMHFVRAAIVTSSEAPAHYGPSEADKVAFRAGEGIKVYVVDKRDDWSRVLLVSGDSGWVRNTQITEILQ